VAARGLLILSTPNRTSLSKLAMIDLGEGLGQIPRGTHDWSRFIAPDELLALAQEQGLSLIDRAGLSFSPARGFELSQNEQLNYLMAFVRG
jgi:2-polyprenyl-6-hydroxyphenyl methylase / 3-demethylubiquinone-9 3-methyltransferase